MYPQIKLIPIMVQELYSLSVHSIWMLIDF